MIQVNRIYLIFNRLVTKKFLVDTSDGLKEMKLQPLHYSMIYLENFPSLIIQNLKNGYCSISIVHAMISHSEQQIIL